MKRLKVLMSAYACEPGKGSEPGVGWNIAKAMAEHHDVWVLTRANNRKAIEEELAREPVSGLQFIYFDFPRWATWWKRGGRGIQLYYHLWQFGALPIARRLHREVAFDLAHHVTFVRYWAPSFLALMRVPFLWGPVGGGESAPKGFWSDFSFAGRRYECLRDCARWLAEHDPLVRLTARRSSVALATTKDTARRLRVVGAGDIRVMPAVALGLSDLARLRDVSRSAKPGTRFISVGNLLHWKGFHLGIRAFAMAAQEDAEYWLFGEGPERKRLAALAARLGIAAQVRFFGTVPREDLLSHMTACTALVHPSLHDSGGWVCLEAMAAAKPVICLDLGGPGVLVTAESGIKVPAGDPEQAIRTIAAAMRTLAVDPSARNQMGAAGQRSVVSQHLWASKAERLSDEYHTVMYGNSVG